MSETTYPCTRVVQASLAGAPTSGDDDADVEIDGFGADASNAEHQGGRLAFVAFE